MCFDDRRRGSASWRNVYCSNFAFSNQFTINWRIQYLYTYKHKSPNHRAAILLYFFSVSLFYCCFVIWIFFWLNVFVGIQILYSAVAQSVNNLVTPSSRRSTIGDRDWPGVIRRCSARLEQLAIQRHCVTDTRHLQAPAEDTSLRCFPYLTDLYWTCAAVFFVMLTDIQCSWSFST